MNDKKPVSYREVLNKADELRILAQGLPLKQQRAKRKEAEKLVRRAFHIVRSASMDQEAQSYALAELFEELGLLYHDRKRYSRSLWYFNQSIKSGKKLHPINQWRCALTMIHAAEVHQHRGESEKANNLYDEAAQLFIASLKAALRATALDLVTTIMELIETLLPKKGFGQHAQQVSKFASSCKTQLEQSNKFKIKRTGFPLDDVEGLPANFIEYMKSLGYQEAESTWCAMHASRDAFEKLVTETLLADAAAIEKLLRAKVPEKLKQEQFKITGDVWSGDRPEKPEEVKYNDFFPKSGNIYIDISGQLPPSIEIPKGRALIFTRVSGLIGGKWIKKGPTVSPKDFTRIVLPVVQNRITITLPDQPENTEVVKVFFPKGEKGSTGKIEIQFAPPNPMCEPYAPETITFVIV